MDCIDDLSRARGLRGSTVAAHSEHRGDPGLSARYAEAVDPRVLRDVLGSYPTGVAIVTARDAARRPIGLTINSFASVSLDPPLVVWSLNARSRNLAAFRDCDCFAVNVLSGSQATLATRFAGPSAEDRFDVSMDALSPEGIPVLRDTLATIVCTNWQQLSRGDHLMLLGVVIHAQRAPGSPLVFHEGRFKALSEHH